MICLLMTSNDLKLVEFVLIRKRELVGLLNPSFIRIRTIHQNLSTVSYLLQLM